MRRVVNRVLYCVLGLVLLTLPACNLGVTPTPTPLPTPDLPRAEIIDPPNNRQVIAGTEFLIDIVARDETAGIARVELYVDGEEVNQATPPENPVVPVFRVQMNWLAQGPGFHIVEAFAYRPDGTPSDPAAINIEVLPRATPAPETTETLEVS